MASRRTRKRSSTEGAGPVAGEAQAISVSIRVRPLNAREVKDGAEVAWHLNETTIQSADTPSPMVFTFDNVFGMETPTVEVYNTMAAPIVKSAMEGINGTIFAYGQTSSGKTYTMTGSDETPGIIPAAIADVFQYVSNHPERVWTISVSYLEIYNEVIQDLLNHAGKNLRVRQDIEHGIFVKGLTQEIATSADQVLEVMRKGEAHRHFSSTQMNHESSRSHAVFKVVIKSWAADDPNATSADGAGAVMRVSSLNLVDLAGSERARKTGANKVQLKEGGHINTSLLNLGTVIHKLSRGESHIPYRNSKLTRILQPSLGGNSRTAIICNITPANVHESETVSTLNFAASAKRIKNKPILNEVLDDAAKLRKREAEIKALRAALEERDAGSLPNVLAEKASLAEALAEEQANAKKLRSKVDALSKLVVFGGNAPATPTRAVEEQADADESTLSAPALAALAVNTPARASRRETWCPSAAAAAFFSPLKLPQAQALTTADRNEAYLRDLAELRTYNSALEEEVGTLVGDLENMSDFAETFASDLRAALDDNATLTAKIAELETKVASQEETIAHADELVAALTTETQELDAAAEAAREAAEELGSQLEAAAADASQAQAELAELTETHSELQQELIAVRASADVASKNHEGVAAELAEVQTQLADALVKATEAEREAKEAKASASSLQLEVNAGHVAHLEAKDEAARATDALNKRLANALNELAALKKELKASKSDDGSAQRREMSLRKDLDKTKAKLATLEDKLKETRAQRSAAESEAQAKAKAVKSLEAELAAATTALEKANEQVTRSATASKSSSMSVTNLEKEVAALKKTATKAEAAAAAAIADANAAKAKADELKEAAAGARKEAAAVAAELAAEQSAKASAEALAASKAAKLNEVAAELKEVEATATMQARQLAAANMRVTELETALEAAEAKADEAMVAAQAAAEEAAEATAKVAEATEAMEGQAPTLDSLRAQIDELKAEVREKRHMAFEAKQAVLELESAAAAAEEAEQSSMAADERTRQLEAELAELQATHASVVSEMTEMSFSLEEHKASLEQAEEMMTNAMTREAELEAQIAELKANSGKSELVAELTASNAALEAELAQVKSAVASEVTTVPLAISPESEEQISALKAELAERDAQLAEVVAEVESQIESVIASEEANNKLLQKVSDLETTLTDRKQALESAHASMAESMRAVNELQLEKSSLENLLAEKEEQVEAITAELENALNAQPAEVNHLHKLEVALTQAESENKSLLLQIEQMNKRQRDEARSFGNSGRLRRMSLGMDDDALTSALQDEIMQLNSEVAKLREEIQTKAMEKMSETSKLRTTESHVHQLQLANTKLTNELNLVREEMAQLRQASGPTTGSPAGAAKASKGAALRDISNTPTRGTDTPLSKSETLGLAAGTEVSAPATRQRRIGAGVGPVRTREKIRRVGSTGGATRVTKQTKSKSRLGQLGATASARSVTTTAAAGEGAEEGCNQQ
ncbi:uncharacterized protein AMSG_02844 [Thecamonas trahens ATCC 50062]|uniref:Kinesin motor domain-containing protein n=1 Tax=Thecamonas trahens ATCC 50062 TaxID=461836 RepID=A0A0L0D2H4_THETB|nr:hypothetical protein AMSG_02844 [Thecamonas trahens ATCC 50062]KNC46391.1 hypothetical protein AMSG_02844 [Thecamonas trahens ATCC 50062]|eukprot:XP_013760684.1 hypothetical protein AMSG_02844 [Thecamonas trahens ATCC 50062]